jgi:hypothetical protein
VDESEVDEQADDEEEEEEEGAGAEEKEGKTKEEKEKEGEEKGEGEGEEAKEGEEEKEKKKKEESKPAVLPGTKNRGFGFVNFVEHEAAKKAMEEMNGKKVRGREGGREGGWAGGRTGERRRCLSFTPYGTHAISSSPRLLPLFPSLPPSLLPSFQFPEAGSTEADKEMYVRRLQTKKERQKELRDKHALIKKERLTKFQVGGGRRKEGEGKGGKGGGREGGKEGGELTLYGATLIFLSALPPILPYSFPSVFTAGVQPLHQKSGRVSRRRMVAHELRQIRHHYLRACHA